MSLPIVLLAFANDLEEGGVYLQQLVKEANSLQTIFSYAADRQLCKVETLHNATFERIVDIFQSDKYRGRIAIFHFAGHAEDAALMLNDDTANTTRGYAGGLVPFLAAQDGLGFVYLNGCNTKKIARSLLDSGIPAVVGTSTFIKDGEATRLAEAFYTALTKGIRLQDAWESAKQQMITGSEKGHPAEFIAPAMIPTRDHLVLEAESAINFPWALTFATGQEKFAHWSLPAAAKNPLFGLPTLEKYYDLPEQPYRYLRSYTESECRVFFGRGREISELYLRLTSANTSPVLLFHGQSGTGKSSLLAAGLLPRLHQTAKVLTIRPGEDGLVLTSILNKFEEAHNFRIEKEGLGLRQVWASAEKEQQRPLILLIDQFEELFTQRQEQKIDELMYWLNEVFTAPIGRPAGKILLSYRKEYHAQVVQKINSASIPYENYYLERLDEAGIREVVSGLQSTEDHLRTYSFNVEPQLKEIIASDLLKDHHSSIGPILQIAMTKLWNRTKGEPGRVVSIQDYTNLQKEGLLLLDFFTEQLAHAERMERAPDVNNTVNGLALDLLYFHTNSLGSARLRTEVELAIRYRGVEQNYIRMKEILISLYLLTPVSGSDSILAHDTLAPLVREAYQKSTRPGQRAERLLAAKVTDRQGQRQGDSILEGNDLEIVEAGQSGMRNWTETEKGIIHESRLVRAQKEKQRSLGKLFRYLVVFLGVVVLLLAVITTYRQKRAALFGKHFSEALSEQANNPNSATISLKEALAISPEDESAQKLAHDIYSFRQMYDTLVRFNSPVRSLALNPTAEEQLVVAAGDTVFILNLEDGNERFILPHEVDVEQVRFSSSGEWLFTLSMDNLIRIFSNEGELLQVLKHDVFPVAACISPDEEQVIAVDEGGEIHFWNWRENKHFSVPSGFEERSEAIHFSVTGDSIFIADRTGALYAYNSSGAPLGSATAHEDYILDIGLSQGGRWLFTADRKGFVNAWPAKLSIPRVKLKLHEKRINAVRWLENTSELLTASDDGSIQRMNLRGELIASYRGHNDYVTDLAVPTSGRWFVSAGEDGTIRRWPYDSRVSKSVTSKNGTLISDFRVIVNQEEGQLQLLEIPAVVPLGLRSIEDEFSVRSTPFARQNIVDDFAQDVDYFEDDPFAFDPFADEFSEVAADLTAETGNSYLLGYNSKTDRTDTLRRQKEPVAFFGSLNGEEPLVLLASRYSVTGTDKEGDPVFTLEFGDEVNHLATLPEKNIFVTLFWDSIVVFRRENDADLIRTSFEPDSTPIAVAISPAKDELMCAEDDGVIRSYSLAGSLKKEIGTHQGRATAVAYSDDGTMMASGGGDDQIFVYYDDQKNQYQISSKNETGAAQINSLDFSPDNEYLAAGTVGNLAIIVRTKKNQLLRSFKHPNGTSIERVRFSADGKDLITLDDKGTIRFWPILH